MAAPDSLNVIALISGGKDSFFSILHCLKNGHKIVALANLYPPVLPKTTEGPEGAAEEKEEDLNSYMYQTVGHTVIPLYKQATGIPLYRQEIRGTAVQTGKSYRQPQTRTDSVSKNSRAEASSRGSASSKIWASTLSPTTFTAPEEDETESLIPLLRKVMAAHPEVNAVSTGAILSTYQSTRIESVALRLGLVPLAYLWQYPNLPPGTQLSLLQDMEAVGLDARVIKVASGGLDESFLWENVASDRVMKRIERVMKRFGGGENGSVLGEGGEFETLVLDGPRSLFKGRIIVEDGDREVVREGGGSAWLKIKRARVEEKPEDETLRERMLREKPPGQEKPGEEEPGKNTLLVTLHKPEGCDGVDEPFDHIIAASSLDARLPNCNGSPENGGDTSGVNVADRDPKEKLSYKLASDTQVRQEGNNVITWTAIRDEKKSTTVEVEMENIMEQIDDWLQTFGKGPSQTYTGQNIVFATILLRSMDTFATVNRIYGRLFQEPNPPARVTVACGDMLPEYCQVSITLTFDPQAPNHKRALHVQSRSYWAPANIGPYSQAISVPVPSNQDIAHGPRLVYVAGQIPLNPATMSLLREHERVAPFKRQAILALQHLWRIGKEMDVGWWTSVVAFISSANTGHDPAWYAQLAGKVWEMRHVSSEVKYKDVERDLWDERYHGALGSGTNLVARQLPDYSIIECTENYVPPFFAAEVAGLPRDSWIEWHAHLGVAAGLIKVRVTQTKNDANLPSLNFLRLIQIRSHIEPNLGSVHRCLIEGGTSVTTILLTHDGLASSHSDMITLLQGKCPLDEAYAASKRTSCTSYLDRRGLIELQGPGQIIPCKSIWDKHGRRLAAVYVYRNESKA